MPRLPELRLNQRLQLMLTIREWTLDDRQQLTHEDQNEFARLYGPIEQAHGTHAVPGFAARDERSTALSLAETVERLVRGARPDANLQRR